MHTSTNMEIRQSPFLDYIDDIAMELIRANNAIQPAPLHLDDSIANLDSLQHFINRSKTNVKLFKAQTLLNMDNELFTDLIQPALRVRLTALLTDMRNEMDSQ